jgi:hypothetical protein
MQRSLSTLAIEALLFRQIIELTNNEQYLPPMGMNGIPWPKHYKGGMKERSVYSV